MMWFKPSDPKHQVLWFKNIFDEPYKVITLLKDTFNNIKYHLSIIFGLWDETFCKWLYHFNEWPHWAWKCLDPSRNHFSKYFAQKSFPYQNQYFYLTRNELIEIFTPKLHKIHF